MIQQNPDWPINVVAKFIRTELHLTLSDMAKITKISLQTLQNLEKPDANPTLETMYKLLNAFGVKTLNCKKMKMEIPVYYLNVPIKSISEDYSNNILFTCITLV